MAKRRLDKALEELHLLTAEQLIEIIRMGIPVRNKMGELERDEYGQPLYTPAPPAYFSAAVALLKANGMESTQDDPAATRLRDVLSNLPFQGEAFGPDDRPN